MSLSDRLHRARYAPSSSDLDPARFEIHRTSVRGFEQAFVHERFRGGNGVALLCVHGWPESKRIFWKV
ncbi:MAG: epoxide hydrolase N-terminal domain-containing protein, partial [Actinomycetota bacterium]